MARPYRFRWFLLLTILATFACSAKPQVGADAAAIADRYRSAMQRKGYGFLSEDELARRQEVIAEFVGQHLDRPLSEPDRAALLDGIDRCIDRLYAGPAGRVDYGNGFGSGGEEWMYLNDRDYFRTFQYHLWFGLTHRPLTPSETQRRDAQRQWMRRYLADLPYRGLHETPPREGMRNEEVRPWAIAELEKAFADPMHLLSEPMPDEGFEKLQDRFGRFSNGIWSDLHDMEVAALTSRFISERDPAGRFDYTYSGRLPFDDEVVDLWGNGPSLHFASNADFRGHHGSLSPSAVYDVVRCIQVAPDAPPVPTRPGTGNSAAPKGDLTLEGTDLIALPGTRIARVPVENWFEADKLTQDQLRAILRDAGGDRISIKGLPAMNGPHRGDRSAGEFFVAVQSREGRLAVINLHNYEFEQVMFWCRPRSAKTLAAIPTSRP